MGADGSKKTLSVLLVSASEKAEAALRTALPEARFFPVETAVSAEEAKSRLAEETFALIILNAPLPDALGPELACDLAKEPSRGVLLLVGSDEYESARDAVEGSGVLTLRKPLQPQLLSGALDLLAASRTRLCAMENQTQLLATKMEDIQIVNRAKWVLIDQLKMDESAAHHYIERQAMNHHRSRREVAEGILMTYEN